MNDKVRVTVRSIQLAAQETVYCGDACGSPGQGAVNGAADAGPDNVIEAASSGNYREVNGKEYIKYHEEYEGTDETGTTLIRIDGETVEVVKKGPVSAKMLFQQGKKTITCYQTPFGSMHMGIFTRKIDIVREPEKRIIEIDYSLELNYEHVSDNRIYIEAAVQ